ncbi:hypothetical protein F0562_030554 [Nyssa sinensis]|uniref:Serine-threonine/tyrosine-protein kinase catalytic domain-containing protein n=1 Tax=Nyssa sinensis TaxID=561372 RepID=A0A5J5AZ45_9ASTE|nr:hypothetical protein F0562_030554 [Nyssa sinensis]
MCIEMTHQFYGFEILDADELEENNSSSLGDGEGECGPQKLTRAQRKRLRKKKLKEEALRCRKVIGPLLPTVSDDGKGDDGFIHPSIGNISMLDRLILDHNSLSGNIPKEIGNLSHVIELDLSDNRLIGSISPAIFNISSLHVLYLTNNSLSGFLSLNVEKHQLNLEAIDLSSNQLTGEIPSSLCQFQELRFLYLSRNNFTGQIPRDIGFLSKLEGLYLTTNEITGTIPPSLGNISSLQFIGCVENGIGGEIPQGLGNLLHLKMLGFDYNNLTSEIPPAIFNISSLVYIAFTANRLSGHILASAGLQLPNFEGIFLADNQLSGEFPMAITNASKLIELELSYNFFTGSVPTNLGNLRQFQFLNLAEYGTGGIVSTSGDVYSYGIMLMETFTKRKPTEEMFTENSSLREDEMGGAEQICIASVIELALDCSRETPKERIKMQEVVVRLKKTKQRLEEPKNLAF